MFLTCHSACPWLIYEVFWSWQGSSWFGGGLELRGQYWHGCHAPSFGFASILGCRMNPISISFILSTTELLKWVTLLLLLQESQQYCVPEYLLLSASEFFLFFLLKKLLSPCCFRCFLPLLCSSNKIETSRSSAASLSIWMWINPCGQVFLQNFIVF